MGVPSFSRDEAAIARYQYFQRLLRTLGRASRLRWLGLLRDRLDRRQTGDSAHSRQQHATTNVMIRHRLPP
jgi:predicted amidophosphoribosyltransferase